jgi:hypothetical protein
MSGKVLESKIYANVGILALVSYNPNKGILGKSGIEMHCENYYNGANMLDNVLINIMFMDKFPMCQCLV